jgi:hypothetical protein
MADGLAFGVERALNTQRAVVQAMRERRAFTVLRKAEFEPGAPRSVRGGVRRGQRGMVFMKRHAGRRNRTVRDGSLKGARMRKIVDDLDLTCSDEHTDGMRRG